MLPPKTGSVTSKTNTAPVVIGCCSLTHSLSLSTAAPAALMELSTTDTIIWMSPSLLALRCPSRQHFGVKWEKCQCFSQQRGVKTTNAAFQCAVESIALFEMINEQVNMSFCCKAFECMCVYSSCGTVCFMTIPTLHNYTPCQPKGALNRIVGRQQARGEALFV